MLHVGVGARRAGAHESSGPAPRSGAHRTIRRLQPQESVSNQEFPTGRRSVRWTGEADAIRARRVRHSDRRREHRHRRPGPLLEWTNRCRTRRIVMHRSADAPASARASASVVTRAATRPRVAAAGPAVRQRAGAVCGVGAAAALGDHDRSRTATRGRLGREVAAAARPWRTRRRHRREHPRGERQQQREQGPNEHVNTVAATGDPVKRIRPRTGGAGARCPSGSRFSGRIADRRRFFPRHRGTAAAPPDGIRGPSDTGHKVREWGPRAG